jgi:hypothetical protein
MLLDVAGKGSQRIGIGQLKHAELAALVLPHSVGADGGFEAFIGGGGHTQSLKVKAFNRGWHGVIVVAAVF